MLSRDYREAAYGLLARLNIIQEVEREPLFRRREVKNRLYVIVTSNSGLAGAYNANVLKLLTQAIQADQAKDIKSHVITIGKKGAQFVRRLSGVDLLAVYPAFGDHPSPNDIRPVLNTLVEQYKDEAVDEAVLLYTVFKSNLVQQAQTLQLLPAERDKAAEARTSLIPTFEPDVETVIDQVATRLIEVQIWQAVLESLASEHSMRMLSMIIGRAVSDPAPSLSLSLAARSSRRECR